jgi:uncharacterized protein YjiS (DUF1127 family)
MLKRLPWQWSRAAAARAKNRKNYRVLRDLSDHTLRDIGLSRSDLLALQHGHDLHLGPRPR